MKIEFHIFYSTRMQFTAKAGDWGITSDSFCCSVDTAKELAIDFMQRFNIGFVDCIDANTGELIFSAFDKTYEE